MKKLVNRPTDVVAEMLAGLVGRAPGLTLLQDQNIVVRTDIARAREREVVLISGGGSGHEPAHAGYVGPGMLHAAVSGEIFAAPSVDAVLTAIQAVCGPHGALLIVKNYPTDRLNFGLAAEIARAAGLHVELVLVADDVALDVPLEMRRGIAGTVLVHKIAGAVAATGASLADVADAARKAAAAVGTMAVALGPCTIPSAGKPGFVLGDGEIEIGLGIHGEPGARRTEMSTARELVTELLSTIIARRYLRVGSRVALLVNDLGGTPLMELDVVTNVALEFLSSIGLIVERIWCGHFLTSLETPGVSLSLILVDDQRLRLLDAPAETSGWPHTAVHGGIDINRPRLRSEIMPDHAVELHADGRGFATMLRAGLEAIVVALLANEVHLTRLDQTVGDGDLGSGLARGARAIRDQIGSLVLDDPAASLAAISAVLRRVVGGTAGALYAVFLLRAASSLSKATRVDAAAWAQAFLAGCSGIAHLGGLKLGDRTMLDALQPAAQSFADAVRGEKTMQQAWASAVAAASDGAAATATMTARHGRPQYLGNRVISHVDPGAVAAAIWLEALGAVLSRKPGGPDAAVA